MEHKKHRIKVRATDLAEDSAHTLRDQGRGSILSDVLGSYTGTAEHGEVPEQDADDL